jgi:glucuronate isomerase
LNGRDKRWDSEMKKLFAKKGYEPDTFDTYAGAIEQHKGFFERNEFLFER